MLSQLPSHCQSIDLFHNAFRVDPIVLVKISNRTGLAKMLDPKWNSLVTVD